jgi:hypothetical protein
MLIIILYQTPGLLFTCTLPLEWNNLDDNRFIRNKTFKTALKYIPLKNILDELADNGIGPLLANRY